MFSRWHIKLDKFWLKSNEIDDFIIALKLLQKLSKEFKFLNFPIVSGNVSFYNETKDKGIKPTPTIGGVGLIKDYNNNYNNNKPFLKLFNSIFV